MVLDSPNLSDHPIEWARYYAFGQTLATNGHLANWLPESTHNPDLTLSFAAEPPLEWNPALSEPIFSSRSKSEDGRSVLTLYRLESCQVMRFAAMADFYIWSDRVVCVQQQIVPPHLMNTFLFANVLPFWLEIRGYLTLHASAVNLSGAAVAFIGHSQNGKSTLAGAFLQEGYPLLSDDVLPLGTKADSFWAYPGYAAMRMWPEEAEHFLAHHEDLERVHPEFTKRYVPVGEDKFGAFHNHACPLNRIYILERQEASNLPNGVEIKSVSHRDAMIELLRYSFVTRLAEAAGLAPDRFTFLAGLAQDIPLRRLIYPNGYEYLPQVRQAILADG